MYHTSLSYSCLSGGCGRFPVLSFPSHNVDETFCEDERYGFSGHGSEKGGIIFYYGDIRINISRDDGDLRGDIRFDAYI